MTRTNRNIIKVPRIVSLKVENYRALKSIHLDLNPMTVLLGPNGSGKSTVFDVFNFLSDCFLYGLRHAWDKRGRGREIRTRGCDGPVSFEIQYRDPKFKPVITYRLAINEGVKGPEVVEEFLKWRRVGNKGQPFKFLSFSRGEGYAIRGEDPDESQPDRYKTSLRSPDLIAVNTLGQLSDHPRVAALREFITDWYVSYLSVDRMREQPEAGPKEKLSKNGDNLPNVIQYLKEQHPGRLDQIFEKLKQKVPRLERVISEPMQDGRLLLQIKDAPFDEPILSKFASDGTLKMLSYLTVLLDPDPSRFIGIEEPENFLHPKLLPGLAESCREATAKSQVLITSHSPFLLDVMRPEEVRVLFRDEYGYTQVTKASEIAAVVKQSEQGGKLGDLWMEGVFEVGDPLVNNGMPKAKPRGRKG